MSLPYALPSDANDDRATLGGYNDSKVNKDWITTPWN